MNTGQFLKHRYILYMHLRNQPRQRK